MKKKANKVLSILLCLALMLKALPGLTLTAFAAEGGKSVMWGTGGIVGGGKDYVYFGSYKQSSDGKGGYNVDPVKWRVLDANNSDNEIASPTNTTTNEAMLLLSEQNLDAQQYYPSYTPITWEKSSLRAWMNGTFYRAAFTAREQTAIAETHVKNPRNSLSYVTGGNDTYDKIFALCEAEAESTAYGFADENTRLATNTAYAASIEGSRGAGETCAWWLRSPGHSEGQAMYIDFYSGMLHSTGVERDPAVRPAFNLNSDAVLFTSAAEGGKPEGFHAVSDYSGSEWKLTLLDGSREFSATGADTLVNGKLPIVYVNSQTGENEYISAALVTKDGTLTCYGRLKNVASRADRSGTVEIDLSDITIRTSDTLYIFNEQDGGDYKTDFASEPKAVPLPEEAFKEADVILEANGGSINSGNITYYAYGEGATLPTDVTRNGYIFEGWYESENFSGNRVTEIASTEREEKTFYARWTALPAAAPAIEDNIPDLTGDKALTYGGSAEDNKLTVTATPDSGTEYDLTYQWYRAASASSKDGAAAIQGATNASYAIPTNTATGDYYYYCTVTATRRDNGEFAAAETGIVGVTVNKKPVAIDWGTTSFVYDGTKKAVNPTVSNAVSGDTVTLTVTDNKATAAGDYTAMVTSVSDSNYTLDGVETTKAWNIVQSATDYEGGSMKAYKGDNEATEFTYGDTITVKVKPYATGTAAPVMPMSLAEPTENQMALYVGNTQISEAVSADGEGYYTMNVDTMQTALIYGNITLSAKYVGNDNMASHSEDVTITLSKADAVQTTAPSAVQGLIYNGEQQTLIAAGSEVTGGTIKYKLADGEYSEELPKAANAETYTVYYKIFGDENHNDSSEQSLTVTVNKKPVAIDWGTISFVYNRTEQAVNPTVTNAVSGDTVTLTVTDNTATAAGNYTAKVTAVSDNNYTLEGVETTKEFIIGQKVLYKDNINLIADVVYTGEELRPVIEVMDGDTVLVLDTDYEVEYQNNINVGTEAEAIVTFKGNYKGKSKREFTILPKTINTEIPLTAPVANAAPQTTIDTDEYTATVVWSPQAEGKFAYNTAYTAAITITPTANYTLAGISENSYTAEGAEAIVNEADSGIVTVTYPKTDRGLASVTTSDNETTDYGSLEEAVTAAQSIEGATITLLKDVTLDSSVTIESGSFTIDLNGKTWQSSKDVLRIGKNADIEITDKSENANGKLAASGNRTSAIYLYDTAKLTFSGGTADGGSFSAICTDYGSTAELMVTGGTLTSAGTVILFIGSRVAISGGEIEGGSTDISWRTGTLDLSEHPNPVGISVYNGTGAAVKASKLPLKDGFVFLNSDESQVRTLAYGQQYTVDEIELCPNDEHNWSKNDGVCVVCGHFCPHDLDEDYACIICGYASPNIIRVGEAQLKDEQYLANGSATPTDTQPDGGYAYYKDGVLTLHDYVYSGNGSHYADIDGTYSTTIGSLSSLVINVEGANSLTNLSDDSDAVTVGNGDLTIIGEGTLNVSATYGFYVYDGDVTAKDGVLNIETELDGIYSGNDTRIEGGTINISTGDVGINASQDIIISGGKLSVKSDGDGLYAYSGDVVINGGEAEIEAAVDGIYAYEGNITIEGGKSYVAAGGYGIDGVNVSITGADTVAAAKGSIAIAADVMLTIEDSLGVVLPENGSVGSKTVLDSEGNTAYAAYIGKKELTEHSHDWSSDYSFDTTYHFKRCLDSACPLADAPAFLGTVAESHDFDDDYSCTVCAMNLWNECDIVVGNTGLHNGEYLDNDGNVTTAQPTGGYAYYEDGVLTMKDYTYIGKGYNYGDGFSAAILFCGDLEIVLNGANMLTNKAMGGEGISLENGSLTIGGSGSLSITATCGMYINDGSVTTDGRLDIDAVEVAVITKGGDVTVNGGTVGAKAGYAGILAENGSVTIEDGEVSITAGVISIDSFEGAVWVKPADGRRIAIYNASSANGEAIDGSPFTSETDITGLISGGAFYSVASNRPASSGGGSSTTRYTIKFETNGGSKVASKTVARNATLAEPTAPTKDGYSFIGWFTDEELTTAYDFDTKVTKGFTLYAKWAKHDDEKTDDKTDETDNHDNTDTTPDWENPFEDVKPDDWYYEDVMFAVQNGLMNGTAVTTFAPDDKLTRAMLVTVLYRLEGEPAVGDGALGVPFEDVAVDAYYADAVSWAKQNEIVNGMSETEFAPDQNVTRGQIAAIMHRYAQYKGYDAGNDLHIVPFDDVAPDAYYAEAVLWAKASGIIQGKDNHTFAPQDNAARAEIAAILHRFIRVNQ